MFSVDSINNIIELVILYTNYTFYLVNISVCIYNGVLSGVPGHRLQRAGLSGVYPAESTGGRRYGGHQGNRGCFINHISFSITSLCSAQTAMEKIPEHIEQPLPVQTSTEHDTSPPPNPNLEQPLSGSGAGPNIH